MKSAKPRRPGTRNTEESTSTTAAVGMVRAKPTVGIKNYRTAGNKPANVPRTADKRKLPIRPRQSRARDHPIAFQVIPGFSENKRANNRAMVVRGSFKIPDPWALRAVETTHQTKSKNRMPKQKERTFQRDLEFFSFRFIGVYRK